MCASIVVSDTCWHITLSFGILLRVWKRWLFVKNYLCNNELSMRLLAFAMEIGLKEVCRALFLEHEGYFGALGSMLLN